MAHINETFDMEVTTNEDNNKVQPNQVKLTLPPPNIQRISVPPSSQGSEYEGGADFYNQYNHTDFSSAAAGQHVKFQNNMANIPMKDSTMQTIVPDESSLNKLIGFSDICGRNDKFWKSLLAEYLGTLFFVLIACGSILSTSWGNKEPNLIHISLTFGITIICVAATVGHVSGAHLNPAVSIGLIAAGQMSILKAIAYIIAQILGAITGSAILQAITPVEFQGNLGSNLVSDKIEPVQGMFLEALLTFILVLTVCVTTDKLRPEIHGIAPIYIGLWITVCHLGFIPYTGSSLNPARSFGPAVLSKTWENHWVYWIGPILGGTVAGFIYRVMFEVQEPKPFEETEKNK